MKLVHAVNSSVYGVRKMWHALKRLGEHVGRDQVARLMRLAGLRGVSRRKRERRTSSEAPIVRAEDLVQCDWFRDAPDLVWLCDFERQEALLNPAVMKGHRRAFVAANA